jgi:outer membrane protein TolC
VVIISLLGPALVFQVLDIVYVPLRQDIAEDRFEAVQRRVAAEALAAAARTRIAACELLAANARVALLRAALDRRERSLEAMECPGLAVPALDLDRGRDARDEAKLDLAAAEAERGHAAGRVGAFELLDAGRARDEAEIQEADATRDYWIARAELELLLAGVAGE